MTMGGTLDEFNTAKYPDTYGNSKRLDWGFQPNGYLVLENVGTGDVVDPRIVIDGRRDGSRPKRCWPASSSRA